MQAIMQTILTEYEERLEDYRAVEQYASEALAQALDTHGIHLMQMTHRIKSYDSLTEKLQRKLYKYDSVQDITDIVGIRIICYFSEQVDQAARVISELFTVDWANSCDKRKALAPTAFGYLSVHYICSLPPAQYPAEVCGLRFEIQIRTVLQHVWAEIEHDLGYKTEYAIPWEIRREFSRVAGLLETADDAFSRIKTEVEAYTEDVQKRIENDSADELLIDLVTLSAFMQHSRLMHRFLVEIASIKKARILHVNPENCLSQLRFFGLQTLGDLTRFIRRHWTPALHYARNALSQIDIDELTSNAAFFFLFRTELISGQYDMEKIKDFLRLTIKDEGRIIRGAQRIQREQKKLEM